MPAQPKYLLGLCILLLLSGVGLAQPVQRATRLTAIGLRIAEQAGHDVGFQEKSWRNDHPIFDYYRQLGNNKELFSSQHWRDPYCGFAVYAWHRQAGVKPPLAPGRAIAWSRHPTRITLGMQADPDDVAKLDVGWVIGFRFDSNHVGIIEIAYPLYAQTIEGNTSLSNSLGHYHTKNDGVIRKIRFYKTARWAADWRGSPASDTVPVLKLRSQYLKLVKK